MVVSGEPQGAERAGEAYRVEILEAILAEDAREHVADILSLWKELTVGYRYYEGFLTASQLRCLRTVRGVKLTPLPDLPAGHPVVY